MSRSHRSAIDKYAPAFFGLRANLVTDLIVEQGARFAQANGIDVPVRAMSTLLCLKEGPATVTEIAAQLSVTHAAVIKTTRILADQGLLERKSDPNDARRRPLNLTTKGQRAADKTVEFIGQAQRIYLNLFSEIGIDVFEGLCRMELALHERSFDQRLADLKE